MDWNHFIKENIERLPVGFIKKGATDGFQFIEDPAALPKPQREAYYKKLADAIFEDDDWKQFLTTRFSNALDIALSRVAWNYKTAIPVYYVKDHKMQLLLPLALEHKGTIDVALVCNLSLIHIWHNTCTGWPNSRPFLSLPQGLYLCLYLRNPYVPETPPIARLFPTRCNVGLSATMSASVARTLYLSPFP